MPVSFTQLTWDASSQSCTISLRRANTAATSSSAVTASRAPLTRCAARRACPLRSSAFEGMQAQYEHSPPTSSLSMSTAVRPPCTARSATFSADRAAADHDDVVVGVRFAGHGSFLRMTGAPHPS